MKKIISKYSIILLLAIGTFMLLFFINTKTINVQSLSATCKNYSAIEIAHRGYSHDHNGPGGQIIIIDITGNTSSNNNSSSNNNVNSGNAPAEKQPSQDNSGQAPSNPNNNQNGTNNSGVSFGSSTSSQTTTVSPITAPTDNNQNTPSDTQSDILSNISSNEEVGKPLEFSNTLATVKVTSDNDINEELTLRSNKLLLNYNLQNQLGGDNEYFELYFAKGINEKVQLSEKDFKIIVKINPEREFLGFYEVIDDTSIKTLNYNKTNDDTLEFDTKTLGKYIICYKKQEISSNENTTGDGTQAPTSFESNKSTSNDNDIWIVLGIALFAIIVVIIVAIIIFKKFVL